MTNTVQVGDELIVTAPIIDVYVGERYVGQVGIVQRQPRYNQVVRPYSSVIPEPCVLLAFPSGQTWYVLLSGCESLDDNSPLGR